MKRYIPIIGLLLTLVILLGSPVYAGYTYRIPISVYNNSTDPYTGLPLLLDIDNTNLYNEGLLDIHGLASEVMEGATVRAHMVTTDKLGFFLSEVLGEQSRTVNYRLGVSPPKDGFSVITGLGGNVTIPDDSILNLREEPFSITLEGYVDTSEEGNLVVNDGQFALEVAGEGELTASISQVERLYGANRYNEDEWVAGYETGVGSLAKNADHLYVYATDSTSSVSQRTYVTDNPIDLTGIDNLYIDWANTVSYTQGLTGAYLIVSTDKTGPSPYDAILVYVNHAGFTRRIEVLDVSGLSGNHYIRVHATAGGYRNSKVFVYRVGIELDDLEVVSPGLSSGEYKIEVWRDATHFGIDIDGVTEDSVLCGDFILSRGNDWKVTLPYFHFFSMELDSSEVLRFEPSTMIVGTSLPNKLGSPDGIITWGSNPIEIVLGIGGMHPSASYTAPSAGLQDPPAILPKPGETHYAEPIMDDASLSHMPLYPSVLKASASLDWSVQTSYSILILITALGLGFAALVAIGSIPWFMMAFGLTMAAGSSTGVVPVGLIIVSILFVIFLGYIWRQGWV